MMLHVNVGIYAFIYIHTMEKKQGGPNFEVLAVDFTGDHGFHLLLDTGR